MTSDDDRDSFVNNVIAHYRGSNLENGDKEQIAELLVDIKRCCWANGIDIDAALKLAEEEFDQEFEESLQAMATLAEPEGILTAKTGRSLRTICY